MSTSSSSDECEFDSQLLKLCKKTWEQLGSEAYYPELPFASEHLESVIPLWKILNASQNIRNKTFSLDDRVVCDFEELKCDLQYLLFGMNSSSFFYNCVSTFKAWFYCFIFQKIFSKSISVFSDYQNILH